LVVTPVSGSEMHLTWQDNSHGGDQEDGFIVQRKPYGGIDSWHQMAVLAPDTTTYTDTERIYGMITYTYRVGALNSE